MERVNPQAAETARVTLRRLAQQGQPSLDDSLRRVLPNEVATPTAAFTSAL